MGTAYEQHDQDKLVGPSAMPVRATLRSSIRDPDLGTSLLYSTGAAPSRILFKMLFCARPGLLVIFLFVLLLLGLLHCLY